MPGRSVSVVVISTWQTAANDPTYAQNRIDRGGFGRDIEVKGGRQA